MTSQHNDESNDSSLGRDRGNSQDYYKKGSLEMATENALTLTKIQHVSFALFDMVFVFEDHD